MLRDGRGHVGVAALAAVLISGVVAGIAPAQDVPLLTGATTVTGEGASYVDVELPQDVVTHGEERPSFALEGEGEFLGFALRAHGGGCLATFKMFKLGRANEGAYVYGGGCTREGALPAGRYRLYFLSERPGRVTFRFPGLEEDESVVAASNPVPLEFKRLPQVSPPLAGYEAFGATSTIENYGFVFSRVVLNQVPPGTSLEICHYDHRDEPAGAYGPGCPGGRSAYKPAPIPSTGSAEFFVYESGNMAGRYGRGYNVVSPLPGISYGIGVWFSYVDPPAPAPTPPPPTFEPAPGTTQPPTEPGEEPPPSSEPQAPPTGEEPGVAYLAARKARVARGLATLRLRCVGTGACRGFASLRGSRRSARFSIARDGFRKVRVRVPRRLLTRVRRRGRADAVALTHSRGVSMVRVEKARVRLVRRGGEPR